MRKENKKLDNKDGAVADVIDSNGDRGTKDIIINYNIKTRNQVFYVLSLPLLIFLPVQDFNDRKIINNNKSPIDGLI